jgi:transposase InsO family protein
MKPHDPLTLPCEVLAVSRSGDHAWGGGHRNRRPTRDAELRPRVCAALTASRQTYGYPRLTVEWRDQGERVGKTRVARLMREAGRQGRQRRADRPRTTQSDHAGPIPPNRLAELPVLTACDQAWQVDITYVPTAEGWLYLAVVLDAYSKRLLGWAFSASLDSEFVVTALLLAITRRGGRCPKGLRFHSDRGVPYTSARFRAQLTAPMSRRGNCSDNARAEAFFSTLKLELVYRRTFADHAQARSAIFEWIEAFYNLHRRHSSHGIPVWRHEVGWAERRKRRAAAGWDA